MASFSLDSKSSEVSGWFPVITMGLWRNKEVLPLTRVSCVPTEVLLGHEQEHQQGKLCGDQRSWQWTALRAFLGYLVGVCGHVVLHKLCKSRDSYSVTKLGTKHFLLSYFVSFYFSLIRDVSVIEPHLHYFIFCFISCHSIWFHCSDFMCNQLCPTFLQHKLFTQYFSQEHVLCGLLMVYLAQDHEMGSEWKPCGWILLVCMDSDILTKYRGTVGLLFSYSTKKTFTCD